ncbi:hypothetical protein PRZ48_005514 [Zasmidium cellare]|uniref:FAD-binding PCMH-type domain-containing protein n=1 Tax=Zasmidium cellare TaxID=395010 RepID=A0ABR0EU43_ZASCE|nr:hypothetical protein PRZ48_005514 [Zasmidium cellare]
MDSGKIYTALAAVSAVTIYYFYARWTAPDKLKLAVLQASAPNDATKRTYQSLIGALPRRVFTPHDGEFLKALKLYFASQAQHVLPAFIVRPTSMEEVATAVRIMGKAITAAQPGEVQFAVRSGGHSAIPGAAGVEGGILIDLSLLNSVIVAKNSKTVDVQPGVRWKDVYRTLDAHGLSCAGGRACDVGVGGLILGGNNFAIVTKYTLHTFQQAKLWTGHIYHWPSSTPSLLESYYHFSRPENYDPCATVIFAIGYFGLLNLHVPAPSVHYTNPVKNPPALQWLTKAPHFHSTLKIRTMSEATHTVNSASAMTGLRWHFTTTTFENNLDMTLSAHAAYRTGSSKVRHVSGVCFAIVFQPLVPSATKYHDNNSLGIDTDKTLTVVLISVYWKRAIDDEKVYAASEETIRTIESEAKAMGVYHPYKYANYASKGQEVLEGYGAERVRMLREVAKKYDPSGVFGKRSMPGGFKLQ